MIASAAALERRDARSWVRLVLLDAARERIALAMPPSMTKPTVNIRELTLEERQERARQRVPEMLAELDANEFGSGLSGRPRIELPPKVARRVLDDLESGASFQAIVSKYRRFYRFSTRWLREAWKDGRLERMATTDPSEGGRRRLEI